MSSTLECGENFKILVNDLLKREKIQIHNFSFLPFVGLTFQVGALERTKK